MTKNHTPTPWKIVEGDGMDYNVLQIITDVREHKNQVGIANVDIGFEGPLGAEQPANAAFIVRAVNAHDALVEALESLMGRTFLITGEDKATDLAMAKARAALELAKC